MVCEAQSVLYVGTAGAQSIGRERALVASGIAVASVVAPEMAVTYVRSSNVRLVLLDDAMGQHCDLSLLAGSLKVASPSLRIIAMVSPGNPPRHVDTILEKPIAVEVLLHAVQMNLAHGNPVGSRS
jgi:DNA-binding NtrC family response regulator